MYAHDKAGLVIVGMFYLMLIALLGMVMFAVITDEAHSPEKALSRCETYCETESGGINAYIDCIQECQNIYEVTI